MVKLQNAGKVVGDLRGWVFEHVWYQPISIDEGNVDTETLIEIIKDSRRQLIEEDNDAHLMLS